MKRVTTEAGTYDRERVTLHDEMRCILSRTPTSEMDLKGLADAVNLRGLYRKRDGSNVEPFQIRLRAMNYPEIFRVLDDKVLLL